MRPHRRHASKQPPAAVLAVLAPSDAPVADGAEFSSEASARESHTASHTRAAASTASAASATPSAAEGGSSGAAPAVRASSEESVATAIPAGIAVGVLAGAATAMGPEETSTFSRDVYAVAHASAATIASVVAAKPATFDESASGPKASIQ